MEWIGANGGVEPPWPFGRQILSRNRRPASVCLTSPGVDFVRCRIAPRRPEMPVHGCNSGYTGTIWVQCVESGSGAGCGLYDCCRLFGSWNQRARRGEVHPDHVATRCGGHPLVRLARLVFQQCEQAGAHFDGRHSYCVVGAQMLFALFLRPPSSFLGLAEGLDRRVY